MAKTAGTHSRTDPACRAAAHAVSKAWKPAGPVFPNLGKAGAGRFQARAMKPSGVVRMRLCCAPKGPRFELGGPVGLEKKVPRFLGGEECA
jgi:hypothetical protein